MAVNGLVTYSTQAAYCAAVVAFWKEKSWRLYVWVNKDSAEMKLRLPDGMEVGGYAKHALTKFFKLCKQLAEKHRLPIAFDATLDLEGTKVNPPETKPAPTKAQVDKAYSSYASGHISFTEAMYEAMFTGAEQRGSFPLKDLFSRPETLKGHKVYYNPKTRKVEFDSL